MVKMTYHNVLVGFKEEMYNNHEAINTIIMAVKKEYAKWKTEMLQPKHKQWHHWR